MRLTSRVKSLERTATPTGACTCRGGVVVADAKEGDPVPAHPGRCPHCRRERTLVVIRTVDWKPGCWQDASNVKGMLDYA